MSVEVEFSEFLLTISGISASLPKVYKALGNKASFLKQLTRFLGDVLAFPPLPDSTGMGSIFGPESVSELIGQ